MIRVWWPWLSGRSLSPLIKGDYPEDAGSIPATTGNKKNFTAYATTNSIVSGAHWDCIMVYQYVQLGCIF